MTPIISLITDFGSKDFYTGVLKGTLLKEIPQAQLVDICHEVTPFDMAEAAFVLKNSYRHFPNETLHIICVNEKLEPPTKHIVVRHNEHYFIGPDNGLFSLAFEDEPELVYELEQFKNGEQGFGFVLPMLAGAAKFILTGGNIKELGKPIFNIYKAQVLAPSVSDNGIRGSVVYIDSFENVVVNITKTMFDQARGNRNFILSFKRSERIREVSTNYHDVTEGERLCIFNTQGYLEIAVNQGKASSLLGLHVSDTVQIDFL